MEMKEIKEEINSRIFRLNYIVLDNAVVAFFFEDQFRLGTLSIAMPGSGGISVGRSSTLLGGKYMMASRALAERLAGKTARIGLVSLFTQLDEMEALRIYGRLLDKLSASSE